MNHKALRTLAKQGLCLMCGRNKPRHELLFFCERCSMYTEVFIK